MIEYRPFERDGNRYEPVAMLAPGSSATWAGKAMMAISDMVAEEGAEAVLVDEYGAGVIWARTKLHPDSPDEGGPPDGTDSGEA